MYIFPSEIMMQEAHTDCVYEIPYNFELIGKSRSCRVEAIKHKTKHIYGTQFHPEASGNDDYKILDSSISFSSYY